MTIINLWLICEAVSSILVSSKKIMHVMPLGSHSSMTVRGGVRNPKVHHSMVKVQCLLTSRIILWIGWGCLLQGLQRCFLGLKLSLSLTCSPKLIVLLRTSPNNTPEYHLGRQYSCLISTQHEDINRSGEVMEKNCSHSGNIVWRSLIPLTVMYANSSNIDHWSRKVCVSQQLSPKGRV
jgi:hypothetical protein